VGGKVKRGSRSAVPISRATDAEVVALTVAQAIMDIASDREFVAVARSRLRHLIAKLPEPPAPGSAARGWRRRSSG
jgi:hypothetical protein